MNPQVNQPSEGPRSYSYSWARSIFVDTHNVTVIKKIKIQNTFTFECDNLYYLVQRTAFAFDNSKLISFSKSENIHEYNLCLWQWGKTSNTPEKIFYSEFQCNLGYNLSVVIKRLCCKRRGFLKPFYMSKNESLHESRVTHCVVQSV